MKMDRKVNKNEEEKKSRRDLLGMGIVAAASATGILSQEANARRETASPPSQQGLCPRWAMVVDLRRCIGCRGCTVSCKSEFNVPLGEWQTVVKQYEQDTPSGSRKCFLPRMCNHCESKDSNWQGNPPCVNVCPERHKGTAEYVNPYNGESITYTTGPRFRRPDGITIYDPSKCKQCGNCIEGCPFEVLKWDPNEWDPSIVEKDHRVSIPKCVFCFQRVDNGILPSCVNTCQGRARIFGDLNDPDSEVSQLDQEFGLTANRDANTLRMWKNKTSKVNAFVLYIDPDGVLDAYQPREEFSDKVW